jgi:hypothetical protein
MGDPLVSYRVVVQGSGCYLAGHRGGDPLGFLWVVVVRAEDQDDAQRHALRMAQEMLSAKVSNPDEAQHKLGIVEAAVCADTLPRDEQAGVIWFPE